jgi:hypothetical protein
MLNSSKFLDLTLPSLNHQHLNHEIILETSTSSYLLTKPLCILSLDIRNRVRRAYLGYIKPMESQCHPKHPWYPWHPRTTCSSSLEPDSQSNTLHIQQAMLDYILRACGLYRGDEIFHQGGSCATV